MAAYTPPDKTTIRRQLVKQPHVLQSLSIHKRLIRSIKNIPIDFKRTIKKTFFPNKKRTILSAALLIVIIEWIAFGFYEHQLQNSPQAIYKRSVETMTNQVNKYVSLPRDEQPVLATITDLTALPNEAFFSQAQNGDRILMYKKHQLAVLFRPSTGKVITEAKLNFEDIAPTPLPAQSVAGAATAAATIAPSIPVQPSQSLAPTSSVPYQPQGKILIQPQQ